MVVGPVVSRKLTELPCRLTFMMRSTTLAAITSLVWLEALAVAWDFPGQKPFFLHDHNIGDVDIVSGSQFRGLQTYANLPYVNCFADREGDENSYDIAIVGAPFDTVRILPTTRDLVSSFWLCRLIFAAHRERRVALALDMGQAGSE